MTASPAVATWYQHRCSAIWKESGSLCFSAPYALGFGLIPGEIVVLLGYLAPTVLPFFVSTAPRSRLIGIALIGSLSVAIVVQRDAMASVWCFFAAILSGLILGAIEQARRIAGARAAAAPV